MKDFKEFIETLTDDEISKISLGVNEKTEYIRNTTQNSKNILGNQVGAVAIHMTLALLSRYHEWNNS